jgi:anaerobic magnesium-protoporphyrin IX monomethyl ester cyclase
MRILLVNVPHPSIGSRIPDDHLPPLGLLAIGGPLKDAGHDVTLLDFDLEAGRETALAPWKEGHFGPLTVRSMVARVIAATPDLVMFGHSGSTSAHPVIEKVSRALAEALPDVWIVYGGVFPTYHFREILSQEPYVDVVVRGEGEETACRVARALETGSPLSEVRGIAYREGEDVLETTPSEPIKDLDSYRVGWELIDFESYSYWGQQRAVVVQFSRGCPHLCNYCGQRGFWTKWRHRDPKRFAKELAWLHREHGVEVVNFADENPTVDPAVWKEFLLALIAEQVPLVLVGSTRADDIVRDEEMLPLYRKAGWTRFLLGTENTDEATLALIRKGGTTKSDKEAIRLLRKNGILSMATWVAGFEEDSDRDFWRGLRQLLAYDPDQTQALYVTPHRWTPYFRLAEQRKVIVEDPRRWDYKHQVLSTRHMPPWRVFLWVKTIEAVLQLRPRSLKRTFLERDPRLRHAMRWYAEMGRRVWLYEVRKFVFGDERTADGPTVREMWGAPQDERERSMAPVRLGRKRRRNELPLAAE